MTTLSGTQEYDALRDRMIAVETKLDLLLAQLGTITADHEVRLRSLEGRPLSTNHEDRLRQLESRTASWKGGIVAATSGCSVILAVLALVIPLLSR